MLYAITSWLDLAVIIAATGRTPIIEEADGGDYAVLTEAEAEAVGAARRSAAEVWASMYPIVRCATPEEAVIDDEAAEA